MTRKPRGKMLTKRRKSVVQSRIFSNSTTVHEQLRQKSELINLSRDAIFVVDGEGKIVLWSHGAERLYGWKENEVLGRIPIELLKTVLPRSIAQIETILRNERFWESELVQTAKAGSQLAVTSRWSSWRDQNGRVLGRLQVDTDISKRKRAEEGLRVLSGRLLNLRDEERRRLARDLHDSAGQLLAGAAMNLSIFEQQFGSQDPAALKVITQCSGLVAQALKEIRTLSYLLHPPLLDEVGLISALQWYVTGFSERSQIKVSLIAPSNLARFQREAELALFRIVQEGLTNIHRHSGSPTATITISNSRNQIRLKVEDQGKGMAAAENSNNKKNKDRPIGVGISGIRERVTQLGGQMQIRSSSAGTIIEVLLPALLETSDEANISSI